LNITDIQTYSNCPSGITKEIYLLDPGAMIEGPAIWNYKIEGSASL